MKFSEDFHITDKIALPTIWHIPDDLWAQIQPLLLADEPSSNWQRPCLGSSRLGRPRLCPRRVLDGILHVMPTGCPWKAVPASFGSGSSSHRYFQRWSTHGIFEMIWVRMLEFYIVSASPVLWLPS